MASDDTSHLESVQAAILVLDLAHSSKLSIEETLNYTRRLRHTLLAPLVALHGRALHINTWGDGLIVVMDNAEVLAAAALDVRDQFRNAKWEACGIKNGLGVRIALHYGFVQPWHSAILGRNDYLGHGLVVGSRLEPLVTANDVWLTSAFEARLRAEGADLSHRFRCQPIGKLPLAKQSDEEQVLRLTWSPSTQGDSDPELSESDRLGVAHEVQVRMHFSRYAATAHDALRFDRSGHDESWYVEELRKRVQDLCAGDEVWAVCGDKNWTLQSIYEYMNLFPAAAIRGVRVRRYYVRPATGFAREEQAIIHAHLEWAQLLGDLFRIRVVVDPYSSQWFRDHHLPQGVGIVVTRKALNGEPTPHSHNVLIHYGLQGQRRCQSVTDPLVCRAYMDIIAELEGLHHRVGRESMLSQIADPCPQAMCKTLRIVRPA